MFNSYIIITIIIIIAQICTRMHDRPFSLLFTRLLRRLVSSSFSLPFKALQPDYFIALLVVPSAGRLLPSAPERICSFAPLLY